MALMVLLSINCCLGSWISINQHKQSKAIKAWVCYFLSNFYFSLNDSPSKTMKNVFLFHLKSCFRFRDIQIFVF